MMRLRDRIALRKRLGDLVAAVGRDELRAEVERFLPWLAAERAAGRVVDVRELYAATSAALNAARRPVSPEIASLALRLAVRRVRDRIRSTIAGAEAETVEVRHG